MSFKMAVKSFFKALKDPVFAEKFLCHNEQKPSIDLSLLVKLQHKGRLVDFFEEDISGYQNEDIGLCVRKIHEDCQKVLRETLTLEPVVPVDEGKTYTVEAGYDPKSVKLSGNVIGSPSFQGVVRHRGWKSRRAGFPRREFPPSHRPARGRTPSHRS